MNTKYHSGFTLAEMAVVLVIVGLLLGGLLIPLSTQNELRYISETQKSLSDVRDALLGYAVANGRFPCPADGASGSGVESPAGGGICTNPNDGFVPGVTLGIGPTNAQGYVIDAWGNRIHYAVTTSNGSAFTTSDAPLALPPKVGMKTVKMNALSPDMHVCSTSAGASATTCAAGLPPTALTASAVAVIFSTGKEGSTAGRGADEIANLAGNRVFVSHEMITTAGSEFDDIVSWISPNILYNRMIAAGQLP
jgi:prepilin-type N-terminal cleavage/methylation domain-containing protein